MPSAYVSVASRNQSAQLHTVYYRAGCTGRSPRTIIHHAEIVHGVLSRDHTLCNFYSQLTRYYGLRTSGRILRYSVPAGTQQSLHESEILRMEGAIIQNDRLGWAVGEKST